MQALPAAASLAQLATPPTLADAELSEWLCLPAEERQRIMGLLRAFAQIAEAGRGRVVKACERIAAQTRQFGRGFSGKNLYRLYQTWLEAGKNWRALVRNYHCGNDKLPAPFVQHWLGLVGPTTRADAVNAARVRLVHDQWFRDVPIPGYGRRSEWWAANRPGLALPDGKIERPGDVPRGWSETNLRRYLPRKAARVLANHGFFAAHGYLPQLLRDRSKLRPLELIAFDDHRLDFKALFYHEGKWQVAYVNCIFAICVATGVIVNYGFMPTWEREDGTRTGLNANCIREVFCGILEKFGLPPYTMHVLVENAVAAFSKEDEAAFGPLFGNRLVIDNTTMWRKQLIDSGFHEEGGSPWQKGWLEATFRPLETRLSALALGGTTGNPRMGAEVNYALAIIKSALEKGVNPDELKLPIPRREQADAALASIVHGLNCRDRHNLQGFERVFEWRDAAGRWHNIESGQEVIPAGSQVTRRREMPAERFLRLLRDLVARGERFTAAPPAALYALAADKFKVIPRNGRITLNHDRLGDDPLVFENLSAPFPASLEKQELTAFLSRDNDTLHLLTPAPDLRHVLSLPRRGRVDILDAEASGREQGRVARSRQFIYDEAAALLAPLENRLADMRAHNDGVFARAAQLGESMAAGEVKVEKQRKATRDAQRSLAREAEALAVAAPAAEEPPPPEDDFDPSQLL